MAPLKCVNSLANGCSTNPVTQREGPRRRKTLGGQAGGGVLDRRDALDFMYSRSRMTIDPRIPTMPMSGRSMSGFQRPGGYCLHQGGGWCIHRRAWP